MQTENKKGFQVKDLIVTALLSLCALVIYILCAFLSFSPYTMLVVSPLWSLLAAITYFLVAAKTKKPWTLFIFCAITGIYGFYPPMIICCIIAGIISALIAKYTLWVGHHIALLISFSLNVTGTRRCTIASFIQGATPYQLNALHAKTSKCTSFDL